MSNRPRPIAVAPQAAFFPSPSERVALARRRYFEEGTLPSGIVSHAVFQSWARCQRLHEAPADKVAFQPVSSSRAHLSLQKNRELHAAWLEELPQLQAVLGSTSCAAMLTDASGVLIGATCVGRAHERLMPVATRIGVNLSEEAVGTTAPGVVARTGQAVSVLGPEHFFDDIRAMHCAAAPIRDNRGRLVGVLDISTEVIPFNFDASAVVGLYAGALENRLLVSQSREQLVLRFQIDATLLDSPAVALVGINSDGRMAWCNGTASRLLGLAPDALTGPSAEELLGAPLSRLAALPGSAPTGLHLPNGLFVWARSAVPKADGRQGLHQMGGVGASTEVATRAAPVEAVGQQQAAAPASLRESDLDLITRTLQECGGNVSKTAGRLGVSRGLVYRRLRSQQVEQG
jgi:transcriptional regulator of acetoin/glycerol metabolism